MYLKIPTGTSVDFVGGTTILESWQCSNRGDRTTTAGKKMRVGAIGTGMIANAGRIPSSMSRW
ncbi:MAG: hypothetical protein QF595_09205 [Dehalococcoidia bacterium]|nr:hypothetical protein [Dehalococcoidia bacterium]